MNGRMPPLPGVPHGEVPILGQKTNEEKLREYIAHVTVAMDEGKIMAFAGVCNIRGEAQVVQMAYTNAPKVTALCHKLLGDLECLKQLIVQVIMGSWSER